MRERVGRKLQVAAVDRAVLPAIGAKAGKHPAQEQAPAVPSAQEEKTPKPRGSAAVNGSTLLLVQDEARLGAAGGGGGNSAGGEGPEAKDHPRGRTKAFGVRPREHMRRGDGRAA